MYNDFVTKNKKVLTVKNTHNKLKTIHCNKAVFLFYINEQTYIILFIDKYGWTLMASLKTCHLTFCFSTT